MTRPNSSRESSSRRSRSSGRRPRSRHRHGHRSSRSRLRIKYKEKNFLAAICSMVVIVILCTALAEPKWIHLQGGGCQNKGKSATVLSYLGVYQFFYPGRFLAQEVNMNDNSDIHVRYQFGPGPDEIMDNCVTYKAVLLLKTTIAFMFIAILCSLVAFILDLIGPPQRGLKLLRRNAVLNVLTVIVVVVVDLFIYWLTTEVDTLQRTTKLHNGSKVEVTFDIGFYLVTAAGALSVVATAFNCLRRYPMYEGSQGESLLDDYDGMDAHLPSEPPELSPMENLPPPPAYTP